jgi:hypothetical protein
LWRLWGEVSGEVRRCQLRRVGCSARWLAQARDDKASGFPRNPHPADRLCDYSLAINLKESTCADLHHASLFLLPARPSLEKLSFSRSTCRSLRHR